MGNEEASTNPRDLDTDELPDVRAFEDEFTRSFLQSTEETRPGYYPFVSGTGAYRMDFPAEGNVEKESYAIEQERFEAYFITGVFNETFNFLIKINYYSFIKDGNVSSSLDGLNESLEKTLQFKQVLLKDRTLYMAPFKYEDGLTGFAALLQNESDSGNIEIVFNIECATNAEKCSKEEGSFKERIIDWMKSIKFVKSSESE